jgi:hypothetical protein
MLRLNLKRHLSGFFSMPLMLQNLFELFNPADTSLRKIDLDVTGEFLLLEVFQMFDQLFVLFFRSLVFNLHNIHSESNEAFA